MNEEKSQLDNNQEKEYFKKINLSKINFILLIAILIILIILLLNQNKLTREYVLESQIYRNGDTDYRTLERTTHFTKITDRDAIFSIEETPTEDQDCYMTYICFDEIMDCDDDYYFECVEDYGRSLEYGDDCCSDCFVYLGDDYYECRPLEDCEVADCTPNQESCFGDDEECCSGCCVYVDEWYSYCAPMEYCDDDCIPSYTDENCNSDEECCSGNCQYAGEDISYCAEVYD